MLVRPLLNPNHQSLKMMSWRKYWNFFLWMTWYDSAMIISWPRKMKWKNVPWIIIYGEDDWTYCGSSAYGAKSRVLEGEVPEVGVGWLGAVRVEMRGERGQLKDTVVLFFSTEWELLHHLLLLHWLQLNSQLLLLHCCYLLLFLDLPIHFPPIQTQHNMS